MTNQHQIWPQYNYILIRSWMSLIMGQTESEHPDLFAFEFGKIDEYDFVYTQSVYDHKISDEFEYETNQTRTVQVVCP